MQTVRSADGTTIAFDRSGQGPAVVLVVGAFCDRLSSQSLAAALAAAFTVYEYDRRGRGDSGDTDPYAIEREVEDLQAVVEAAGDPPFVYGHSSGAAIALEAAARGVPMRKLVVYEPPYNTGRAVGFADELRRLIAAGQPAQAAERFLLNTGAPPQVVGMITTAPHWPRMVAIAHTLPYDVSLSEGGAAPAGWMAEIGVPTLALAGGASADWAPRAARSIASTVPGAQQRVLPGQDHNPAVGVIAAVLTAFFGS